MGALGAALAGVALAGALLETAAALAGALLEAAAAFAGVGFVVFEDGVSGAREASGEQARHRLRGAIRSRRNDMSTTIERAPRRVECAASLGVLSGEPRRSSQCGLARPQRLVRVVPR